MATQEPRDCFISHASEDKDAIARPLAEALTSAGYSVWFDEYELVLGDSLRAKIDEGLAASRFGVVVLSPQFFEKGWPQSELNALAAKEMVGGERLILPVWYGVDEEFLASKSPLLADRIGVPSDPLDKAVEQIIRAIERRKGQGATAAAIVAAQEPSIGPTTPEPVQLVESQQRVKLRLTEVEREAKQIAENRQLIPGWLAIVAGPVRLQTDLIDPIEVNPDTLREVTVEDCWYHSESLNRVGLRADHTGFFRRMPDDETVAPDAWLKIWEDGLMEYGQFVSHQTHHGQGGEMQMVIPTTSIADLIHDYALLFLNLLLTVGYEGEAVVVAHFADLQDHRLGVSERIWLADPTVRADYLQGRPLQGPIAELPDQVGIWTKRTMDRLFLTAGVRTGYPGIDATGARVNERG
jgi:TIR domain